MTVEVVEKETIRLSAFLVEVYNSTYEVFLPKYQAWMTPKLWSNNKW